jgi:hypothetical protein
MEQPSELEKFLRQQEAEGRTESAGSFSISRRQALEKLASFQLPFEGAWSVKLIQSAVAAGVESAVVRLGRQSNEFCLTGRLNWTFDELEQALLDPEYGARREILHLVTALRSVGISQKRGFSIELATDDDALVWDGQTLQRTDLLTVPRNRPAVKVTVTTGALDDEGGFLGIKGYKAISRRNAEVTQCLTGRAHTCPIPLSMDGRRLDALELNRGHGWGPASQLMVMGFEDGELPPLQIPAATGSQAFETHGVSLNEKLMLVTEETRSRTHTDPVCSLAYLVSAHMAYVKKGKRQVWEERTSDSFCNWVADGVIVETEVLSRTPDLCSVGCFVSADGLDTDLTSFHLLDNKAKNRRRVEAKRLLRRGLDHLEEFDFERMHQKAEGEGRIAGGIFLVLGLGSMAFSPIHGVVFTGVGAWMMVAAGNETRAVADRIQQSLHRLESNLT